jgi:hypothetical protein
MHLNFWSMHLKWLFRAFSVFVTFNIRDLKQTRLQCDDDGYSHNDIPDLVQKKWIIKSHTGVRDVVLGLFTTANQRFSRLVYNANISRREKWNYKFVRRSVFNHKTFVLVSSNWTQFIYTCWVDNTQQLFFATIYLKKFVLAVVVALPSYMLKVPINVNIHRLYRNTGTGKFYQIQSEKNKALAWSLLCRCF